MKRLFAGFIRSGSDSNESSLKVVTSNNNLPPSESIATSTTTPRRSSLLRRGISRKASGGVPADNVPTLITNAAATLADALQEIVGDTTKLSGENTSGYETLLCILNDNTDLDEVGEILQANGMGCIHLLMTHLDHPKFVELCSPVALAAGLFQALRLLRMYEIKIAKTQFELCMGGQSSVAANSQHSSGVSPSITIPPSSSASSTFDASYKICKILEKLCSHSSVIEQIRANLVKILTFPLCILPLQGKHIQQHAAGVVLSICKTGFTSQQVWYLHDVQCITHMIRHLHELTTVANYSPLNSSLSRSPLNNATPIRPVSLNSTEVGNPNAATDYLLRGLAAETEGMWTVALECFVRVLAATISIGSVLLNDFEAAFGNKLLVTILRTSSPQRFLNDFNIITQLLFDPNRKEVNTQQILIPIASTVQDFLYDVLGLAAYSSSGSLLQGKTDIESLKVISEKILDSRKSSHLHACEYMIQGMAYSLLTMYSNEPIACLELEESYHFLPLLLLSLPALSQTEVMSAVLTTLNYVCQCIEIPSMMIIKALSAAAVVVVERFLESNNFAQVITSPHAAENLAIADHQIQQMELIFVSIEAICRTNKNFVLQFLKIDLFSFILKAPLLKFQYDLPKSLSLLTEEPISYQVNAKYLIFYERILLLVMELNEKNGLAAQYLSGADSPTYILDIAKSILLQYPYRSFEQKIEERGSNSSHKKRFHLRFFLVLLRCYEELAKADGDCLSNIVMILRDLILILGRESPEKVSHIYNTLWSICIVNEGYHRTFLSLDMVETAISTLALAKQVYATTQSKSSDLSLTFHWTLWFQCITSVLRYLSILLFYAFENDYNARSYQTIYGRVAQVLIETGIFTNATYRFPALILILRFITVFSKDEDIIYTKSLDMLAVLLPNLPIDLLVVLIRKLENYTRSNKVNLKRIGDNHLLSNLIHSLNGCSSIGNDDFELVLPRAFVTYCVNNNWHADTMIEILRSCVKRLMLSNGSEAVLSDEFSSQSNPRLSVGIRSLSESENRGLNDNFYGLSLPNKQSPFEEVPYLAIPLYPSVDGDSNAAASLAMFFNESTVPMPSSALTISTWIRVSCDQGTEAGFVVRSTDENAFLSTSGRGVLALNTMIPVVSMESAGSNIHLSIEINPLTADAVVLCTMRSDQANAFNDYNEKQDLLVFKPAMGLSIDSQHWTHFAVTMKRVKRFTASNQVQIALYFNGVPWIPHSSLSSTANTPPRTSQQGGNNNTNIIGGILSMDPLGGQNGEIRLGLPKDSMYHHQGKFSPEEAMQMQQVILEVANVALYQEALQSKQISMIFLHGPGYVKMQPSSDTPLLDSLPAIASRCLTVAHEMSKNALIYMDKMGLSGLEYIVEPRLESHPDLITSFELPPIPMPIVYIHPFYTAPEHIILHSLDTMVDRKLAVAMAEDDEVSESDNTVFATKARLSRSILFNAIDLESKVALATLSSGGFLSRSISVGDSVNSLGGPDILFPLLLYANTEESLLAALKTIRQHLLRNNVALKYMQSQGYRMMAFLLSNLPRQLVTVQVMEELFHFAVSTTYNRSGQENILIVDSAALLQLVFNHYLWGLRRYSIAVRVLQLIKAAVSDDKYAAINIMKLSCVGVVRWVLQTGLSIVQSHQLFDRRTDAGPTEGLDVWFYEVKTAMELADYRDEPVLFMKVVVDIVRTLLRSELKARDLDLIMSMVLYTFLPSQNNSANLTGRPRNYSSQASTGPKAKHDEVADEEESFEQNTNPSSTPSHLHPFCTYPTAQGEQSSPESGDSTGVVREKEATIMIEEDDEEIRYLTALELYRVYLIRLLFTLYDDNLEELRRSNRRPSAPKAFSTKDLHDPQNTSNNNLTSPSSLSQPPSSSSSSSLPANIETDAFNIFRQIVAPHVLIGMLEHSSDVSTTTFVLRLLAFLLQKDSLFNRDFINQRGYQVLYHIMNAKEQIELPILLPILSLLFRIPIQLLMHPYQIKHVDKVIQLIDLEESLGPNVGDITVLETAIPMLTIFYTTLNNVIKYYNNHNLSSRRTSSSGGMRNSSKMRWYENMKNLLLKTIDYALDHCASFRSLMQHLFSLETHINTLLVCTNAYSDYGAHIYDSVHDLSTCLEEDYINNNTSRKEKIVRSSENSDNVGSGGNMDESEDYRALTIEITHEIGPILLKQLEKIMIIALKDCDNNKILYHLFVLFNTQIYSANYETSYQLLIVSTLKKVIQYLFSTKASPSVATVMDMNLVIAMNKNVLLLLPLLRCGFLYYETIYGLLEVLMEGFVKYSVLFQNMAKPQTSPSQAPITTPKAQQSSLDQHQNALKELNLNIRYLTIFALHFASHPLRGLVNGSMTSLSNSRYQILTFLRDYADYLFYYIIDDNIDPNILRFVNTNKMTLLAQESFSDKSTASSSMTGGNSGLVIGGGGGSGVLSSTSMSTSGLNASTNLLVLDTIANMAVGAKNINKNLLSSNVYLNTPLVVNPNQVASHANNIFTHNLTNNNQNINFNTYKLERSKICNIFIVYLLHYTYHLVLEEDTNTRIQATRIIALLVKLRKSYVETLLSNALQPANVSQGGSGGASGSGGGSSGNNTVVRAASAWKSNLMNNQEDVDSVPPSPSPSGKNSPFFAGNATPGGLGGSNHMTIDVYRDGISKLIPNSSGYYDIDLRMSEKSQRPQQTNMMVNNEDTRFADFSYWVSEYGYYSDKVFAILTSIISSVLPSFQFEYEEWVKLSKIQLHIVDLWTILYPKDNNSTGGGSNTNSSNSGGVGSVSTVGGMAAAGGGVANSGASPAVNASNDQLLPTSIVNANGFNQALFSTITNANLNANNYLNNALYNHVLDIYSQHLDNLQSALIRLYLNNKIGEKVGKMFLYWYRDGIRDVGLGGMAWKRSYQTLLASAVWGRSQHQLDQQLDILLPNQQGLSDSKMIVSQLPSANIPIFDRIFHNIYEINRHPVYRLDYILGPNLTRRRIIRDFTNYKNTYFSNVTTSIIASNDSLEEKDDQDRRSSRESINQLLKKVKKKVLHSDITTPVGIEEEGDDLIVMNDGQVDEGEGTGMVSAIDEEEGENVTEGLEEEEESLLANTVEAKLATNTSSSHLSKGAAGTVPKATATQVSPAAAAVTTTTNSAQTSAGSKPITAVGAGSSIVGMQIVEPGQFRSLMIKEILRAIIGFYELKKCQFYNIERIFGLESQIGLLVLTPLNIHLISGFRCISSDMTKSFNELAFDYACTQNYSSKSKTANNNPSAAVGGNGNNKEDEKYAAINAIYNEHLLQYDQGSVFSSHNTTYGGLYHSVQSDHTNVIDNVHQLCQENGWMHTLWVEMMESEAFYDKIKIEEVGTILVMTFHGAINMMELHHLLIDS
eukprot:scaffold1560_cov177-Ochromonas_danica.AAC.2